MPDVLNFYDLEDEIEFAQQEEDKLSGFLSSKNVFVLWSRLRLK